MTEKEEESEKVEEIKEDDESGLEEDLEKTESNIDQNKFQDVMININSKSPSLEQVAVASEPLTSLEMGVSEAPRVKEDEDEIKYNAINYDEKKDKSYSEKQEHRSEDFVVSSSGVLAKDNLREKIQVDTTPDFQVNPEAKNTKSDYTDFKMSSEDLTKRKTQDPFQKSTKEYEFR